MAKNQSLRPEGFALEDAVDQMARQGIVADKTELQAVVENLDSDSFNEKELVSNIDFNTRLTQAEVSASLVIDTLARIGVFPQGTSLTRQLKRLKVSLNGQGRAEKVEIVRSERDRRSGGILAGLGSFFKRQP